MITVTVNQATATMYANFHHPLVNALCAMGILEVALREYVQPENAADTML